MRIDSSLIRLATLGMAFFVQEAKKQENNASGAELNAQTISQAESSTRKLPENISPLAEVRGEVSYEFIVTVNDALKKLPSSVEKLLLNHDYKVILAPKLTDVATDLDSKPVGWNKRYTWNNVDGIHRGSQKVVIIAEKKIDLNTKAEVKCNRVKNVCSHEVGHAVLAILRDKGMLDEKSFEACYAKDVKSEVPKYRDKKWSNLAYLLTINQGKEEAFAEVFAALSDNSCNPPELVLEAFPNLRGFILGRLKALEN